MERWVAKVISLLVIFIVALVATLLPLKLKGVFERWGKIGELILSYMMCFGGGVFFSIYMLHMAPEALEIVHLMIVKPKNINYPLGELLISLGFFLMVFSEKIVQKMNKPSHKVSQNSTTEPMSVSLTVSPQIGKKLSEGNYTAISRQASLSLENIHQNSCEETNRSNGTNDEVKPLTNDFLDNHQNHHNHTIDHTSYHDHENTKGHSHDIDLTGTRSIILLLALSLHHVFEGISVGLKHSVTAVWNLTIAILSHEVVIAFSLGLQLVKAYKSKCKIITAAFLCTLMVPIGIAIGMLLMETGHGESEAVNIANGILQSLATGVFIYVTFFEILVEEISHSDTSLMKLVFMLLGFITMALLALIPEDLGLDESANNCTTVCE